LVVRTESKDGYIRQRQIGPFVIKPFTEDPKCVSSAGRASKSAKSTKLSKDLLSMPSMRRYYVLASYYTYIWDRRIDPSRRPSLSAIATSGKKLHTWSKTLWKASQQSHLAMRLYH